MRCTLVAATSLLALSVPCTHAAPVPDVLDPLDALCAAFAKLEPPGPETAAALDIPAGVRRVAEHLRRAEALGFTGGAKISRDGTTLLHEAYGFADKDHGRPMAPDAVFDIGSVAKQFTAAAILRLEDMGKLKVTDTVGRFFPEAPADKRDITLHQLLTHTSGLPHDAVRRDELLSRDEGVARILATPLRAPAPNPYQYSNAGFTLLAAIVEKTSGRQYEYFLRDELWRPAGMENTGNLLPAWRPDQFALGYNAAGSSAMPPKQWWVADGPSWSVRGAGYVLSTTDDLVRWAEALQQGVVLSDASRRKLFHPHVRENSRAPSYYGYGWAISKAPDGSCVVAHDGGAGFHEDVLRIYPAHDLTSVFFTSESRSPTSRYMASAGTLLFQAAAADLPPIRNAPGDRDLQHLAGDYRLAGTGSIPVVRTGAHLTVRSRDAGVLRTFSGFPALTEQDQTAVAAVEPKVEALFATLSQGDYAVLETLLPDDVTLQEEQAFWPDQWKAWARDMGSFRGAEVIGHRRAGESLVTYVQMRFDATSLPIELLHRPGGKVYINTVTMVFPERTTLEPRGDGTFLAYNPSLSSGVVVRLDPATRTLTVESTCAGASECRSEASPGGD